MYLSLKSLPSRGHNYPTSIDKIEIKELDFTQLCRYSSKRYEKGSASEVIHDIDCLISDIPSWQLFSCFDISSIIFMRKYISATYDDTAIVPIHNKSYKLSIQDITFKVISEDLIKTDSIILDGHILKFHVATAEEYYNVLQEYVSSDYDDPSITLGTLMLLASLEGGWDNAELVFHATKNDAVVVKIYSDLLEDQYNDVVIKPDDVDGGDTVIRLNYLITDIFRFIQINSKANEDQIITK